MIGNERYQRREDLLVLFGKLADREESKALGEVRQLKHELPNGDVEIYNFYHRGAGLVMELVDMQHPVLPTFAESITSTFDPIPKIDENPYFKKEFIPSEYQTTEPPVFTEPDPIPEPVKIETYEEFNAKAKPEEAPIGFPVDESIEIPVEVTPPVEFIVVPNHALAGGLGEAKRKYNRKPKAQ